MLRNSLFRPRRRPTASDWWEYLGSFGDDFFGDDLVGDGDELSEAVALTGTVRNVAAPAASNRQLLSCGTDSLAPIRRSNRRLVERRDARSGAGEPDSFASSAGGRS